jgi:GalNAc-alpha-(1->4)-GalNAc-alpha-(1->3)-diNAcBac-PP-undecaprenol alpha-1,4-N-acetyl-D-galactosaminyltransferase
LIKETYPLKIVFVISALSNGGAARIASILTSSWAEQGLEVTLFTTYLHENQEDFYSLSPKVKRLRLADLVFSKDRTFFSYSKRLTFFRRQILKLNPQVVISFADRINVLTLISLVGTGVPTIVCERSNPFLKPLPPLLNLLRRFTYRFLAAEVCVQTQIVRRQFQTNWGITSSVISNPIKLNKVSNIPLMKRQKIILSVGRFCFEKGQDLLLISWANIAKNHPDWKLRFVGDGNDLCRLQKLTKILQVDKQVEWMGKVRDVWSEYQKAQIFILPSRYEGFPNALLEAMAMGCACISTNFQGSNEIIDDGVSGLLCDLEQGDSMSLTLQKLIKSPEIRVKFSLSATQVKENYSIKNHLRQWEEIFYKLNLK